MYDEIYDSTGENLLEYLTQWDSGQTIIIKNTGLTTAPYVLFCNRNSDVTLSVKGTIYDGDVTVEIPDTLLTVPLPILGYVMNDTTDSSDSTKFLSRRAIISFKIPVRARTKPGSYSASGNQSVITIEGVYEQLKNKVDKTQYASTTQAGVIRLYSKNGSNNSGITVSSTDGTAYIATKNGVYRDGAGGISADMEYISDNIAIAEDLTATTTVGGIKKGDTVSEGTYLKNLLKNILCPYVPPAITKVSVSQTCFEVGNTGVDITVTVSFTVGSQKITKITVGDSFNSTGWSENGSLTFKIKSELATGQKTVNKVVTATDDRTIVSTSFNLEYVYPYYYGAVTDDTIFDGVAISNDTVKKWTSLVATKGTKVVTISTSDTKMLFAYPSSYGTLSSIKDSNGFEYIDAFTLMSCTVDSVSYYLYVANNTSTGTYKMTFAY